MSHLYVVFRLLNVLLGFLLLLPGIFPSTELLLRLADILGCLVHLGGGGLLLQASQLAGGLLDLFLQPIVLLGQLLFFLESLLHVLDLGRLLGILL